MDIYKIIEEYVISNAQSQFDQPYLEKCLAWLQSSLLGWFRTQQLRPNSNEGNEDEQLAHWLQRLQFFIYKVFGKMRVEEMFDIIVEYPESLSAIDDLKICIDEADLRHYSVDHMKKSFEKRLLHFGAQTSDILTQYISTIKVLQYLDPSEVMLDLVGKPIKEYLSTRHDTIRCIISALLDENNDLYEELNKGGDIDSNYEEDDLDNFSDEDWEPAPIDADPAAIFRAGRKSDVVSILVNIVGGKEAFVKDYQICLADRLLNLSHYSYDQDIKNLELLKMRFGEHVLQKCEIMLKDVGDSKRIDAHVNSKLNKSPVHCMILSRLFWPSFRTEEMEYPLALKKILVDYEKEFRKLKAARHLVWKPHLGTVQLRLEFKDHHLQVDVSPIHATIIMAFQEKPKLQLVELSNLTKISVATLKKKINFWIIKSVLEECMPETYQVLETSTSKTTKTSSHTIYQDEEMRTSQAEDEHNQEEMIIYWQFIVGMLTNLGTLPLDRIHNMLSIFIQAPHKYDKTPDKLQSFLTCMVREEKLEFANGMYKLKK